MKNILVGLSGGPSVAINSSLAGIIKKASEVNDIDNCYGAVNGIEGVLKEKFISLNQYCDEKSLKVLMQTPAMALGSCRHKVKENELPIIADILVKHDIDTFFYIGGNDSMDTVMQLNNYLRKIDSNIKVIGVPKTIDNDLPVTDHSPGYGSSAKYLYTTVNEIIRDSVIYPIPNVVIVEIMGRNSGFLTLAAGMPNFVGGVYPQVIAIPEVVFDENDFIKKVNDNLKTRNTVVCVVSEGIKQKDGEYVGMTTKSGAVDIFGHTYLSGVGKYLETLVKNKIGCKVRSVELNIMQRCSSHLASKTDIDEAFLIGEKAIDASVNGKTGITLVYNRTSNSPYKVEIGETDVSNIANKVKYVPQKWFNLDNKNVKQEITDYILPLIKGDIEFIKDENEMPEHLVIK